MECDSALLIREADGNDIVPLDSEVGGGIKIAVLAI